MSIYTVRIGSDSNDFKGKRFQAIVKDHLLEQYKNQVDLFKENFKLKDVKITVDFYIVLKNGKHIFIEAKYRNGQKGKGLCKEEATHAAINSALMTHVHCTVNKIKDYSYEIYTNGVPKEDKAPAKWLEAHIHIFKTVHQIILIENCEDEVENRAGTNTIEDLMYG